MARGWVRWHPSFQSHKKQQETPKPATLFLDDRTLRIARIHAGVCVPFLMVNNAYSLYTVSFSYPPHPEYRHKRIGHANRCPIPPRIQPFIRPPMPELLNRQPAPVRPMCPAPVIVPRPVLGVAYRPRYPLNFPNVHQRHPQGIVRDGT
jgi:hypothetical protein